MDQAFQNLGVDVLVERHRDSDSDRDSITNLGVAVNDIDNLGMDVNEALVARAARADVDIDLDPLGVNVHDREPPQTGPP